MTWQALIGISVILYSTSVLLQRSILKENESRPVAYSILFQLIVGALIGIYGLVFADMRFPSNLRPLLFNLILAAVLYGLANIFIFKSLKETEASRFIIVFSLRALFTVLASSLLLKEVLTSKQFMGSLLILAGVVVVNLKSSKLAFGKGELFALLAALAFGFANTNDRYALASFNIYPYVALAFVTPAILVSFVFPGELKYMKLFVKKNILTKVLLLCSIYAISALTFFAALQVGKNSSQVASVNLTSVILTVLLSIVFLKEKDKLPQKILGTVLAFIGLLAVG